MTISASTFADDLAEAAPPSASLRRLYLRWIDERIEAHKESLRRDELLDMADEVIRELEVSGRGQYQLTEILLAAAIDRKIFTAMGLPGFRRWRTEYLAGRVSFDTPDEADD